MAQMLPLSSVVVLVLAACQTDPDGFRSASAVTGTPEALGKALGWVAPACAESLPRARTLVLRGADCAARSLRRCAQGGSHARLDAELRTLAEGCGVLPQAELRVGATFEDGCAEEIRLNREVPSSALRCLADALNGTRLDCADKSDCALVGLSTLATN